MSAPRTSPDLHHIGDIDHSRMQTLLGYNLAQATIQTSAIYDAAIGSPLDLRNVEFTILSLVESNQNVTQKQLSLALSIAAPNLTVILDRMEAKRWISRTRGTKDRRSQHITLADEGRRLLKKALAIAATMESQLLSHLSTAETAMLFELLQKIAVFHKSVK